MSPWPCPVAGRIPAGARRWALSAAIAALLIPTGGTSTTESATEISAAETPEGGCRLTVDIPDGFVARQDRNGLVLQPIGQEGRRALFEIRLRPGSGGDASTLTMVRPLGPHRVRYRLDRDTGGSGGQESTLVAEKPMTDGRVRMEAWLQRDDGVEPDFGPAWLALAAARCSASGPSSTLPK
ncbi:Tsi3 family protein [Methylobacterium sp. B4]|uniref:Tsi3 family protein n=1 Tax=Methylobacterium sp. B4 TaxID=1938755 RepID=UPI000D8BF1B9|nr:Tsi3 family protein [Methylobacterium sp. B4]PXW64223.1 hypothetical protein BY998_104277 [Methylobacterium sp. B4]